MARRLLKERKRSRLPSPHPSTSINPELLSTPTMESLNVKVGRIVKNPDLEDQAALADQGIENSQGGLENNFLAPEIGGQEGGRLALKHKRLFYDIFTGKKSSKEGQ
ncbi:hypothetical protein RUND412_010243 [Rhizina undulata]